MCTILDKLIRVQSHNYLNHSYNYGQQIKHDDLCELLQRQNNQLENIIQIYKQFIKLNSSQQGHIELNKKLCLIECLKCYVEHLMLFNKFEMLIPPEVTSLNNDETVTRPMKNYMTEMKINFKLIGIRWAKRREEQLARLNKNLDMEPNQRKYPFTYIIDCLIEECKQNSVVAKFLSKLIG